MSIIVSAERRSSYRSLWRLRTYARPYAGSLGIMVVAALVSELAPVAIPLIAQRVIDDAIRTGDGGALVPLCLLALALGVLEAIAVLVRRWVMTRSALGLETDLRRDLYAHLQRLPVAFHDRWQTGQLLSRATGDLGTIRRFVGFGLVFLIVNAVTCLVVGVMLAFASWPLALFVVVSAVPLAVGTLRFERVYATASRRAQDLNGELTTDVEEAAGGVRTVKSFGRRRLVLSRYLDKARTLRDAELHKIRVLAYFWVLLEVHPQVVLAIVVLGGSVAVVQGALTLGGLVAFVSLLLLLQWPINSLGWLVAMAQEAETAAERIYEVLDTPPAVQDRPGARRLPRVTGRVRFEGVGFRYPGRGPAGAAGRDAGRRAGRDGRRGRRHRVRQDHADRAGPPAVRRDRRPDHPRRARRPGSAAGAAARGGGHRVRGADAVLGERPGEPHARPPGRHRRGGARGAAGGAGRVRARPAVGAGHPGRRAGPDPVRRAAAAARAGPRGARPAAGAGAGRPAVGAGRAHRGAGGGGAAAGAAGHHRAGRRAPAVHGAAGRPGGAARPGHASPPSAPTPSCSPPSRRTGTCWPSESDLVEEVAS